MDGKKDYNKYRRPKKTFQDTLTEKEIRDYLVDYKKVDDITKVTLNTHVRYFVKNRETGKTNFRLGGYLNKVDAEKGYVILTNGKHSWSVQIKDAIFFKKEETKNLLGDYEAKLKTYKQEIKRLKKENEELKYALKKIKKRLSKD